MSENENRADNKFGTIIKRERMKQELSLAKLADNLGGLGKRINPSYINRLEAGDTENPSFVVVCYLATALNIDIREVFNVFGFDHLLKIDISSSPDTLEDLIRTNKILAPTRQLEGDDPVEVYLTPGEKERLIELLFRIYEFSIADSNNVVYLLPRIMEDLVSFRETRIDRLRKMEHKGEKLN
ncbi:helix-turn-helix domain-containing protein [Paenibacillus vini]|uniref:HTH cro/C1-type domain-containing protein n=1 Tax=Paenibacillus vini TaxID=1476024 RepID=A0ABQ4MAD4_9BACL|nr:helix-turn-helix transcriptional regulator [Paenibacillus vini]GIP52951.1 hypothetical protein J42TS3_19860 [Paenibacillus vini]